MTDNDQPANTAAEQTADTTERSRRLERPLAGRRIAGVSRGLANYTGRSATLFRVAFVVLTLLALAGVLLYLTAWLLVPQEGEEKPVALKVWDGRHEQPGKALVLGLLVSVMLIAAPHTLLLAGLAAGALWLYESERPRAGQAEVAKAEVA